MRRLTTLVADHVAGGKESACQAGDVGVNPGSGRVTTHSSILAWEIPWTEEPDGLQSVG